MYNKAEVLGHLGQDPQTRNFDNGSVTTFSVATTEQWNDSQTGERKEHTEWHNISVKGKFGEICQNALRKGSKVFVVGKMRTRKWTNNEGQERVRMEIVADEVKFLDSINRQNAPQSNNNQGGYNNQGGGHGDQNGGYGDQYPNNSQRQNAPQGQQQQGGSYAKNPAPQGQAQHKNPPQGQQQQPGSYAKNPATQGQQQPGSYANAGTAQNNGQNPGDDGLPF